MFLGVSSFQNVLVLRTMAVYLILRLGLTALLVPCSFGNVKITDGIELSFACAEQRRLWFLASHPLGHGKTV